MEILDVISYVNKTKIYFPGYNLSFIIDPTRPDQFLATVRQITKYSNIEHDDQYPVLHSHVILLKMDSFFNVIEKVELTETSSRIRYISYTTGIEDCRFISDEYVSGVCLDTNENWQPEMCLCHLNLQENIIDKVIPLSLEGDFSPQKNWLVLEETKYLFHMIHSYDPLQIVSVEKSTGISKIIHLRKIFNVEDCEIHGGASVFLEEHNMYLVTVRLSRDHHYYGSLWFTMNKQYKLLGVSSIFLFAKPSQDDLNHYEMCMSLVKKKDSIYASVSLSDECMYIYEFSEKHLLSYIEETTASPNR